MKPGGGKYDAEVEELLRKLNAEGVFVMVAAADGTSDCSIAVRDQRLMLSLGDALVRAGLDVLLASGGATVEPFGPPGWPRPQ